VVVNVYGLVLSLWGVVEDVASSVGTCTGAFWPLAGEVTMNTAASDSDVKASKRFTATPWGRLRGLARIWVEEREPRPAITI
jgi:hypothetical protein